MILPSLVRCQPIWQCLHFSKLPITPKLAKTKSSQHHASVQSSGRLISVAAGIAAANRTLRSNVAHCSPHQAKRANDDQKLPQRISNLGLLVWILKRQWLPMLIAVTSALLTAVCVALMPLCMEDIVPVLKDFLSTGQLPLGSVQAPAAKLVALCVAQGVITSVYITVLAGLFENCSSQLKGSGPKHRRRNGNRLN